MTFDEWWNHPDLKSGSKVKPLATELVRYGWEAAVKFSNEVGFLHLWQKYLSESPEAKAAFHDYLEQQPDAADIGKNNSHGGSL